MKDNIKVYEAILWSEEPEAIGRRVSVEASNISEAKQKLEAAYSEAGQVYITNAEEASRPRDS